MKRLHLFCLAFNTAEMVQTAVSLCEKQLGHYPVTSKTIFDPHYPAKDLNHTAALRAIAEANEWGYVDMGKNHGVSGGWRFAMDHLGLGDGDVLAGIDPDGRPQQSGWLDAMMQVFNFAPETFYCGLNRVRMPPAREKSIGMVTVLDYSHLISWSLGGFSIDWMRRVNGPMQDHPQYGFIELATERACGPLGGRFYMLRDFYDEHLSAPDANYTRWKSLCAAHQTKLPYEEWLRLIHA